MDSRKKKFGDASYFKQCLMDAEDSCKLWHKRAEEAEKAYLPYVNAGMGSSSIDSHIFWSFIQTVQPSLYSRVPTVVCKPRYNKDAQVERVASQQLESVTQVQVAEDRAFDLAMRDITQDAQLTGRGVGRVRLETSSKMEKVEVELFNDNGTFLNVSGEQVQGDIQQRKNGSFYIVEEVPSLLTQHVKYEHVCRKDFYHSPADTWSDVWWLCFKNYLSYDDAYDFLGKKKAEKLNYAKKKEKDEQTESSEASPSDVACVYEVWNKDLGRVYWYSDDCMEFLEDFEDPYGLNDFFPCPRPLYFNPRAGNLYPVAEYEYIKSDLEALNELMLKRHEAYDMLKVIGITDQSLNGVLSDLLSVQNGTIVPVNMNLFNEKGSINQILQIIDFPKVSELIEKSFASEEAIKKTIYEKTGNSDIIRGITDPRETATAQQMKGQFTIQRLSEKQGAVQFFAKDMAVLTAELVAQKFDPELIKLITPLEEKDLELADPAITLLRSDGLRKIAIEIETDSTIAITETLQKEAWVEFVQAVGGVLPNFLQLAEQVPESASLFAKLLQTGSRLFKFGRAMDAELSTFLTAMTEKASQPQQQGPDPIEMMKLELEKEKNQISLGQLQLAMEEAKAKYQIETEKLETQRVLKEEELRQGWDTTRSTQDHEMNLKTIDAMTKFHKPGGAQEMTKRKSLGDLV
jgi:hypothetical protein